MSWLSNKALFVFKLVVSKHNKQILCNLDGFEHIFIARGLKNRDFRISEFSNFCLSCLYYGYILMLTSLF